MPDKHIEFQHLPRVAAGRARGGRASQQDAVVCLYDPALDVRLLVLADGMGGDGAGELAAEGVIAAARRLWAQRLWLEVPGPMFLETLCQEAHEELCRRRQGLMQGEPHATIVALLLRGDRACWVHVGDSRLYHFFGRRCVERTRDHSLAELRVQRGEIDADEVSGHPDQHRLLRGLGGEHPPQVEHGGAPLRVGQNFALCSDGVWASLDAAELGRFAAREDQESALREALELAVERGGEHGDNLSLILVRPVMAGQLRRYAAVVWARAMMSPHARRRA